MGSICPCKCCAKKASGEKFDLQLDESESTTEIKMFGLGTARQTLMKIVADMDETTESSSGYPMWYFADVDDKLMASELNN